MSIVPSIHLRVDGTLVETIAPASDFEIRWNRNGPVEATWSMALRNNERPSCLHRNAPVEVYAGASMVFPGALAQPDWDNLQFAAIGSTRLGEGAECLTAGGAITSKPNAAIDQAKARGVVDWTRDGDFGNTDIAGAEGDASHDDPEPGKLNELLDLWATEEESQWRITDDRRLIIAPEDEDTPKWFILPNVGVLGVADDEVTDRVFLRYFDSTAGKVRTASYPATTPPGGVERRASVVGRGPMTAARATSLAAGMYRKALAGRTGWSNGLEVVAGQVLTRGGLVANLGRIRGGDTVRMLGAADPRRPGRRWLDFVIDEAIWRPGEQTIQLNPVGLAARTWEQILTDYQAKGAA